MSNGHHPEISVVIIDGQDVVHAGIEAWLTGSAPPIKIVGNFSDPDEFLSLHHRATPAIDVILFALQYEDRGHTPIDECAQQMAFLGVGGGRPGPTRFD
jgi:DNA-binding NarL/FixJ family response regulator